ncbi:uncharacterized protein TNCV_4691931 [Trichonephila clavipes]|nr:uncharacterized protein TNCV_4691931 [Trichonephila clavipes]
MEDLRFKRTKPVRSTGTSERCDRKRYKICRKRSLQGSEYKDTKRKPPTLPQGLKRGVPSSISSRTRKYIRNSFNEHPSQGLKTLSGPSNQQQMRKFSPPKEERRVADPDHCIEKAESSVNEARIRKLNILSKAHGQVFQHSWFFPLPIAGIGCAAGNSKPVNVYVKL